MKTTKIIPMLAAGLTAAVLLPATAVAAESAPMPTSASPQVAENSNLDASHPRAFFHGDGFRMIVHRDLMALPSFVDDNGDVYYIWMSDPTDLVDYAQVAVISTETDLDVITWANERNGDGPALAFDPVNVVGADEAYVVTSPQEPDPEGVTTQVVMAKRDGVIHSLVIEGTDAAWDTYNLARLDNTFQLTD